MNDEPKSAQVSTHNASSWPCGRSHRSRKSKRLTSQLHNLTDRLPLHRVVFVRLNDHDPSLDLPSQLLGNELGELSLGLEVEPLGAESDGDSLVGGSDGSGDDEGSDEKGKERVLGEVVLTKDWLSERKEGEGGRGQQGVKRDEVRRG